VIEIADDGRGIDTDKVKAKAIASGIISETESERMTDKEAHNLIFAPGFSTADKVTDISGRGVGMDVVKTNITNLNGIVAVESEIGVGHHRVGKTIPHEQIAGIVLPVDRPVVFQLFRAKHQYAAVQQLEILDHCQCLKSLTQTHAVGNDTPLVGKDLVDGAPKDVKTDVPKEEAEEMKKKLEEVGAGVELK